MKKEEWQGENPKGLLGKMSDTECRFSFRRWRHKKGSHKEDVRVGHSWSNKDGSFFSHFLIFPFLFFFSHFLIFFGYFFSFVPHLFYYSIFPETCVLICLICCLLGTSKESKYGGV